MIENYPEFYDEYIHCSHGKNNIISLCAGFGTDDEMKKLLAHSNKGIDQVFEEGNALHKAIIRCNPIDYGVQSSKLAIVKTLIDYGADPNVLIENYAPLHLVLYMLSAKKIYGRENQELAEKLVLTLLSAKNIDLQIKMVSADPKEHDNTLLDICKNEKLPPTFKCLLELGHVAKNDVNEHVVRLLDRG